jgi:effector-binding domain-containing protein
MRLPLLVALAVLGAAVFGFARMSGAATESPAYRVVQSFDGWEVRAYEPRLEARVTTTGATFERAVSAGFRVLADFIFGNNEPAAEVAMTTPVSASSTKIAMTTPVAAEPSERGWEVAFTMPSEYTAETLPRPRDGRVRIIEVPGGTWAAIRFRGTAGDGHEEMTQRLMDGVAAAGLRVAGPPVVAQYNPPWIPPMARKNEILVPLDLSDVASGRDVATPDAAAGRDEG